MGIERKFHALSKKKKKGKVLAKFIWMDSLYHGGDEMGRP